MMKRQEEIQGIAYQLWEQANHPEGRALDHWLLAEKMVTEQNRQVVSQPQARTTSRPEIRHRRTS